MNFAGKKIDFVIVTTGRRFFFYYYCNGKVIERDGD